MLRKILNSSLLNSHNSQIKNIQHLCVQRISSDKYSDPLKYKISVKPKSLLENEKLFEVKNPNYITRPPIKVKSSIFPYTDKVDHRCDVKILQELKKGLEPTLITLKRYHEINRHPSRKTFMILSKKCIECLSTDGLYTIQGVLSQAYPKEFKWEMRYDHLIAEILWKKGSFSESMELFEKLLHTYPKRTKKICDTIMFMNRKIISSNSEEELECLIQFSERCVQKGIFQQITNVWFLLITSDTVRNHLVANELFEKHHKVTANYVKIKINRIKEMATEKNNINLLQRLLESILTVNLSSEFSFVFSALLQLQCELDDLEGASRTIRHANQEGIHITGKVLKLFSDYVNSKK